MKIKRYKSLEKLILLFVITISCLSVKAATLDENIASLTTKVNELASNSSINVSLDILYPIGSIFISYSSTNPGTTLGGTWIAFAGDKQLIGNGSNANVSYSAGNTGGSTTKTLAATNLPSHTHSLTSTGSVSSSFSGKAVNTTSNGDHSHGINMGRTDKEAAGYGMQIASSYQNRVMVAVTPPAGTNTASANFSTNVHSVTPKGTVSSSFSGTSVNSTETGSTSAFSVQNPYIKVYMWKRTA